MADGRLRISIVQSTVYLLRRMIANDWPTQTISHEAQLRLARSPSLSALYYLKGATTAFDLATKFDISGHYWPSWLTVQ